MKRDPNRTRHLNIRVTPEINMRLRMAAVERGKSVSELVGEILDKALPKKRA